MLRVEARLRNFRVKLKGTYGQSTVASARTSLPPESSHSSDQTTRTQGRTPAVTVTVVAMLSKGPGPVKPVWGIGRVPSGFGLV
jgi:hypothetical protein